MASTIFDVTPEELEASASKIEEKPENSPKHTPASIQLCLIFV